MSILDDSAAVALLIRPLRIIGFIIPHVVIEEIARDNLFITQHPVERGASISDHAYSLPVALEMICGWSNSSVGFDGYTAIVYKEILKLQAAREPFTVYTPGRSYPSMLISSIEKTTTNESSNSLMLKVAMQQVIIVSTETTSATNSKATQAQPAKTASPVSAGTKQLQPSTFIYAENGG